MASASVATRETPSVPDLVRTPALTITAEDVALPRIYIGQFMSSAVQDGLITAGQIFAASGADDADPVVLWDPKGKSAVFGEEGVKFYVLHLRKGKSWTAGPGEELQLFDFDDPSAPPDAWVTYNYTLAVPDADPDVPFKLLLTRTGKNAALQINTVLKKGAMSGPAWQHAFLLTTAPRENNKGKFFVPRITIGEATPEQVAVAERMALEMSTVPSHSYGSSGEEPQI